MNHLLRSHAPISELAWTQIDDEAGSAWNRRSAPASWSTSPVRSDGSTRPPTSGA